MIEYYPTLTINELSSHEKTWRNLKCIILSERRASPMAQLVKNPPAIWETWVLPLGWEDPLEEGMVTHSSILAGESSQTEEPSGLQFMGSQRVRYDWATKPTQAKEAHLKRLPAIWFHCTAVWKRQDYGDSGKISGCQELGEKQRWTSESESCSVVSDSLQPHGLYGLYGPRNSPGQNTGVGSLSLLQGIFLTQRLSRRLPHWSRFFSSWATREAQEYWNG